jgi:protein-tyrosine phosphatase
LVVCHGNICRSPIAAALLERELAPLGIEVQSAGFIGFNRPAPAEAIAAAESHAVNLCEHRSRLLTPTVVRTAELIVVMEASQQRLLLERYGRVPGDIVLLGDFDPVAVDGRAIHDPVNGKREVFDQVYARIARCVRELAATIASMSS